MQGTGLSETPLQFDHAHKVYLSKKLAELRGGFFAPPAERCLPVDISVFADACFDTLSGRDCLRPTLPVELKTELLEFGISNLDVSPSADLVDLLLLKSFCFST